MSKTSIRKGSRPFFDDAHFPQGFNRSGVFTVQESALLQEYGHTLKTLVEGKLEPQNDEEKQLVNTFHNGLEPSSKIEKVWNKYLIALGPKSFFTLNSGSKAKPEVSTSEATDYDSEL